MQILNNINGERLKPNVISYEVEGGNVGINLSIAAGLEFFSPEKVVVERWPRNGRVSYVGGECPSGDLDVETYQFFQLDQFDDEPFVVVEITGSIKGFL